MVKNIKKNKFILFILFIVSSSLLMSQIINDRIVTGEEYISDDSGNIYMYVNILGHVKSPGTYLVYEGADILSILAQAGGPSSGAKLEKISVYRDNTVIDVNLEFLLESGESSEFVIKPNDSIYIKENFLSRVFRTNALISILQIINILVAISLN